MELSLRRKPRAGACVHARERRRRYTYSIRGEKSSKIINFCRRATVSDDTNASISAPRHCQISFQHRESVEARRHFVTRGCPLLHLRMRVPPVVAAAATAALQLLNSRVEGSSAYDTNKGVFSPQGRLVQLDYVEVCAVMARCVGADSCCMQRSAVQLCACA